jgi:hypothetical protein
LGAAPYFFTIHLGLTKEEPCLQKKILKEEPDEFVFKREPDKIFLREEPDEILKRSRRNFPEGGTQRNYPQRGPEEIILNEDPKYFP